MLHNLETLDERLFLFLNGKHNAFFDFIMYWASDQFTWVPLYIGLAIYFYRHFHAATWYLIFCVGLLEAASDQLSSHVIKNAVRRLRPSHVGALAPYIHLSKAGPGGEYGFVSSHACNTFALTVFILLALPAEYRPLKHGMVAWALLVSYSRIYNGVHYPGDVLCGAVLGSGLAFLAFLLYRRYLGSYLLLVRKVKT